MTDIDFYRLYGVVVEYPLRDQEVLCFNHKHIKSLIKGNNARVAPDYAADSSVPMLDHSRNTMRSAPGPCADNGQIIKKFCYLSIGQGTFPVLVLVPPEVLAWQNTLIEMSLLHSKQKSIKKISLAILSKVRFVYFRYF